MKNKRIEMGNWLFELNPHTPLGFVQRMLEINTRATETNQMVSH